MKIKNNWLQKESKEDATEDFKMHHTWWDELDLHINSFFENKKLDDLIEIRI